VKLKATRETKIWGGLEFVRVPQGEFLMGSEDDDELAWPDEKPQHTFEIPYDYWMGRFSVTNAQFGTFVRSTSYETQAERDGWAWVWNVKDAKWAKTPGASWEHPQGPESRVAGLEKHPVVQVCWHDALAFCEWLNQKQAPDLPQGYVLRLPGEAEWEKAARGAAGRRWPWGNAFDAARCNSKEDGPLCTTPVDAYSPRGDSLYGVADVSGNVWEWTLTLWGEDRSSSAFTYPYHRQDGRENQNAPDTFFRIIRGGSYKDDLKGVRAACRDLDPPRFALSNLGFRVATAPHFP
jgi:formylglycine-generating enzyme required for sulfatase activity